MLLEFVPYGIVWPPLAGMSQHRALGALPARAGARAGAVFIHEHQALSWCLKSKASPECGLYLWNRVSNGS